VRSRRDYSLLALPVHDGGVEVDGYVTTERFFPRTQAGVRGKGGGLKLGRGQELESQNCAGLDINSGTIAQCISYQHRSHPTPRIWRSRKRLKFNMQDQSATYRTWNNLAKRYLEYAAQAMETIRPYPRHPGGHRRLQSTLTPASQRTILERSTRPRGREQLERQYITLGS
jgi:hypothetical protein